MTDLNTTMPLSSMALQSTQGGYEAGRSDVASTVDTETGRASVEVRLKCRPEHVFDLLTDYQNLPEHIFCLHKAEIVRHYEDTASVRYTMKLPFPIGSVQWTNVVTARRYDNGSCAMEWMLVDGDLSECSGKIVLHPVGEHGTETQANYQIKVEHKNRLPKRAQRMMVRWLLPRVINRLCGRLESHDKK